MMPTPGTMGTGPPGGWTPGGYGGGFPVRQPFHAMGAHDPMNRGDRFTDFESRVAQQAEFKFDGKSGGPAWRKRVKNYVVGRNAMVAPLLNYAETRSNTAITQAEIAAWSNDQCDALDLSRRIWTFLGLCLSGDADDAYNLVETCNGVDAWRAVQSVIYRGSEMRRLGLETKVREPKAARDLVGVRKCLQDWESDYKEYLEVDGTRMSERDRKTYLLKILPKDMRENLILNTSQFEQYLDFKNFVLNRTDEMIHLRGGSTGGHHGANLAAPNG